jgi:hypothetical protein
MRLLEFTGIIAAYNSLLMSRVMVFSATFNNICFYNFIEARVAQ